MSAPAPAGSLAGIRFVLIAITLFALQDGISRHLAQSYPVPFFVMIRYWFFALFVLAVAARMPGGVRGALRTRLPLVQCLRGALLALQIVVIVSAYDMIGLAATMAIFALHPLLTTLLAIPVLGERVGWRRMLAMGVGFAGVMVILRPGAEVFDPRTLVALAAAGMFAAYGVLTRMVNRADGSAKPAFVYTGLAGAVTISLIGPWYWVPMAPADWAWLGLLCVTAMVGHYCLIRALEAAEAVAIQPFIYLQMVFGISIGAFVFGETVEATALIGVAMIIGAGLYAIWREWRLLRAAQRLR